MRSGKFFAMGLVENMKVTIGWAGLWLMMRDRKSDSVLELLSIDA